MNWKVVARADNPDQQTLSTLEELTGLGRGEVLLALRRNGLTAGDGLTEDRARTLSASLSGFGLSCTVLPSLVPGAREHGSSAMFRVVLTGYKPGNRARLRERLEKLSGLPPEQVVLWLARIPFVLKDGIDHETARQIRRLLTDSGGIVEIKPSSSPGAAALPLRPGRDSATLERTGPASESPSPASIPAAAGTPVLRAGAALEEEPPGSPEPPALEEIPTDGAFPPMLRFCSPGRAPLDPPVIPGVEDLSRVPQVLGTLPPVISLPKPPFPAQALAVYVSAGSGRVLSDVSRILRELFDFRDAEISLSRNLPFWVATVGTAEKAIEFSSLLEEAGATVLVRNSDGPPSAPASGGPGFLEWLRQA